MNTREDRRWRGDPVAAALRAIGGRWTFPVVRTLLHGPRTFGELKSALGGISSTTLTKRIGSLIASGVITQVPASARERARYALTAYGEALRDLSDRIDDWIACRSASGADPATGTPDHDTPVTHKR